QERGTARVIERAAQSARDQMGFHHRAPSRGAGRRANPAKRKRKRVGIVFESRYQSADSFATHLSSAGPAARVATDVSRIGDVDLAFDCPRSTTIRAAILQDCVYGRVADRRSDRQKSSFNSR